ncbi:MAG: caspase family protein, partial [Rhizobiaceae bacterium]
MPSPRQIFLAVLAVLALLAPAAQAQALKGVALIVGQSKYEHIAPLPNPANDARDVVKLMTDLGFDARSVSDRDSGRLKRDLERFVEDAADADVAFLYYSGHGIEAGGENFLVPVDADLSSLSNADEALVSISAVLDELKSKVPVSIVLLDACRTNPFPADAVVRRKPKASGAKMGASGLTPVRGAAPLTQPTATTESLVTVIGVAA